MGSTAKHQTSNEKCKQEEARYPFENESRMNLLNSLIR